MTFDKRITTHKWGNNPTNDEFTSSNGFVISSGTYDKSITFFQAAAAQAKQDFPHLTDDDIECFIITNSTYNKGFGGVRFSLPDGATHPEYSACRRLDFSTT